MVENRSISFLANARKKVTQYSKIGAIRKILGTRLSFWDWMVSLRCVCNNGVVESLSSIEKRGAGQFFSCLSGGRRESRNEQRKLSFASICMDKEEDGRQICV